MKNSTLLLLTLSLIFAIGCKKEVKKEEGTTQAMTAKKIRMELEPKSESNVKGNVAFTQEEDGKIRMVAIIEGLEPGDHAIHIHEKADCSSPDGKSTGGHWNPTAQPHGKWGVAEGYHKGDIGNFMANTDGNGTLPFQLMNGVLVVEMLQKIFLEKQLSYIKV